MAAVISPLFGRRVVVVIGMHRSGTSLTASVLQAIGVDLGDQLIEADRHNRAGYFEQERIVRLNRRIFDLLDRRWVGPKGTLPLPKDWWLREELRPIQAELAEIVRHEMAQCSSIWGFKDPRVSRLIPMWRAIFADLGVTPSYVLAVRHPAAVSASLNARDGIPPAKAHLLWLEHNLEAVMNAGAQLARVVDFDRWFSDGEAQARDVAAALEIPWRAEALGALAAIVRPELRHARGAGEPALPMAEQVYRELAQASITGTIPNEIQRHAQELQGSQTLLQAWADDLEVLPAERFARTNTRPVAKPNRKLRRRLRQLLGD